MKKVILFTIGLVISFTSWGASIFDNPITGTNPNTSNPYTTGQTVDPNLTATGIGRGSGISGSNANNRYNAVGWSTGSLDVNDYFTFTLTPNSGYKINFTDLTYTSQASGTGPTAVSIRTSLDNYASDIATPAVTGGTIDLSGTSFQGITTSITFRIYAYSAGAGTGTFSVNDFTFSGTTVLPVTLIRFDLKGEKNKNLLSFSTASEQNNAYFSIERSADGSVFSEIGRVRGHGNSTSLQEYTYSDEFPLKGINYYRLKQVDYDGRFEYSKVVSVVLGKLEGVLLSPIPVQDQLQVQFDEELDADVRWELFDLSGTMQQAGSVDAETTVFNLDVSDLSSGTYVLRITTAHGIISRKFQK